MKPLTAISREELARTLDRVQQGEDLERRQPRPDLLAEYFRERNRLRDHLSERRTSDGRPLRLP